jgi:Flp pilus assembly protein TadB
LASGSALAQDPLHALSRQSDHAADERVARPASGKTEAMQTVVEIPWPIALVAWTIAALWRIMILTLALAVVGVLLLDELLIRD